MHFIVHVPDQLQLKVELEVETDEGQLEIELKWRSLTPRAASMPEAIPIPTPAATSLG
jgi:hypothetical protein